MAKSLLGVHGLHRSMAVIALSLLITGAACGSSGSPTPGSGTLHFGMETILTGGSTDGQSELNTVKLWMKLVNQSGGLKIGGTQYKLDLTSYDNQGDKNQDATLVQRLITQDKVSFLFGSVYSGHIANACPVNERYKVPSLNTLAYVTSVYERGFKYCFSAMPPTAQQYDGVISLFKARGVKTVAVLGPSVAIGDAFLTEFGDAAKAAGMTVADTERFPDATTNFSSIIAKLAGANVDAIAFEASNVQAGILFRKQQASQGLKVKLTYLETGPNVAGWEAVGSAGKGVVSQSAWAANFKGYPSDTKGFWGTNADFVQKYHAEYGSDPDWSAAVTAVSCDVYMRALKAAGSVDPEKVTAAISSLTGADFYGPIQFDNRGFNVGPAKTAYVIQDQGGGAALKVVYPDAAADAPLIFPGG